jgi:hypothetical protein
LDFDTSLFHTLSRQATVALLFSSPDFLSRKWRVRIASGDLLPPSPPAEAHKGFDCVPMATLGFGLLIVFALFAPQPQRASVL